MPIVEAGAEETAAVARAFNQMSADLAAIERERSLVLAGISHDLRTPLTRLRLAAEFIGETTTREGVIADVEQMDTVVGQFLDYARLGEQEVIAECDLAELAGSAAAPYASRGVQLELADLPPVRVRPLLLKRALANLLDNAVKYGGCEIALKLDRLSWHGRPAVGFSVLDRGPGIAEDSLEAASVPSSGLMPHAAASAAPASGCLSSSAQPACMAANSAWSGARAADSGPHSSCPATPDKRFRQIRQWAASNIRLTMRGSGSNPG